MIFRPVDGSRPDLSAAWRAATKEKMDQDPSRIDETLISSGAAKEPETRKPGDVRPDNDATTRGATSPSHVSDGGPCENTSDPRCLLNAIANGSESQVHGSCTVCGKTTDQLENEMFSLGNRVKGAFADAAVADEHCDTLATPGLQGNKTEPNTAEFDRVPLELEGYEIGEVLGRGGMGVVYRATHQQLKRTVALKVIRGGMLADPAEVTRFLAEAESAASLDHPNIVPIYEIGQQNDQYYFTMKLIDGGTLASIIQSGRSDFRDVIRTLCKVAKAVQAAHEAGIVHRDLKPGNVLLSSDGQPHVTDFGLAKQLQGIESMTVTGQILGTPNYMAPEQAIGAGKRITTKADIYALGVLLYECLTGQLPHRADSMVQTLRLVIDEEPKSPRHWNPAIDRDLETITLKCLAKDPDQRYASADELARELERWLAAEPILARPSSTAERTIKWLRRHPLHAATAALTLVLLLLLGIVSPIVAWQQMELRQSADQQRVEAVTQRGIADQRRIQAERATNRANLMTKVAEKRASEIERNLYFAEMAQSESLSNEFGALRRVRSILKKWIPADAAAVDHRGWEWFYLQSRAKERARRVILCPVQMDEMEWDPTDEGRLILGGSELWVTVSDSGSELKTIAEPRSRVSRTALSPDRSRLATGLFDGRVSIWSTETWELVKSFKNSELRVSSLSWSLNGKQLACTHDHRQLDVWDLDTEKVIYSDEMNWSTVPLDSCWSPVAANQLAVVGGSYVTPAIIDLNDPDGVVQTEKPAEIISGTAIHWNPDASVLAGGTDEGSVYFWDGETGELIDSPLELYSSVTTVRWSSDGTQLAAGANNGAVYLWDFGPDNQRPTPLVLDGHSAFVNSLRWSDDGATLATRARDQTLRVWDTRPDVGKPSDRKGRNPFSEIFNFDWHPTGKWILANSRGMGWPLFPADDPMSSTNFYFNHPKPEYQLRAQAGFHWSPDGRRVAITQYAEGPGVIVDADLVGQRLDPQSALAIGHPNQKSSACAWSPDGKTIALGGKELSLWNASDGSMLSTFAGEFRPISRIAWSPKSDSIAANSDTEVFLWQVDHNELKLSKRRRASRVRDLVWSPRDSLLAFSHSDGLIELLDATTLESLAILEGHVGRVNRLDFSPDGSRLISAGDDARARLWDVDSRKQILAITPTRYPLTTVDWSPDGSRILVVDKRRRGILLDASRQMNSD